MHPSKVDRARTQRLTDLPNVGKQTENDLRLLGYQKPEEIAGACPFSMYVRLCEITGKQHDPCVIDIFMSITDFLAGNPAHSWWKFTQKRHSLTQNQPNFFAYFKHIK